MGAAVLSLGDVLLREEDLALLRDPCSWLTDQIVAYAVEKQKGAGGDAGAGAGAGAGEEPELFDASVSMLMMYAPEAVLGARPAACGAPALVFVVNNSDDPHRAFGGTHWSVLVFERRSGEFFALDSIRGTNDAAAAALASSLAPLLLGPDARRPTPVRAHPMLPAQTNAHDCGVYACLFLEEIVGWYASGAGAGRSLASLDLRVGEDRVKGYRRDLLRMIRDDVRRQGRG